MGFFIFEKFEVGFGDFECLIRELYLAHELLVHVLDCTYTVIL